MSYTVTRQIQWSEGNAVVEVSSGGLDYTNPDVLVARYEGEFEEYSNPIEAVDVAIEICRSWRRDGERGAKVGIGATGGMTMPFDTCTFRDAYKWARKVYEKLEKCPVCGEIVEGMKEWYHAGMYTLEGEFIPYDDGYKYCSEGCAEKCSEYERYEFMERYEELLGRVYKSLDSKERFIIYVYEMYEDSGELEIALELMLSEGDFSKGYIDGELRNTFGYTDDMVIR